MALGQCVVLTTEREAKPKGTDRLSADRVDGNVVVQVVLVGMCLLNGMWSFTAEISTRLVAE